jgi:hypothetical protein
VTALPAALADHDVPPLQLAEDLLEEGLRDALAQRDRLRAERLLGGGELERGPHRVVRLRGDPHAPIVPDAAFLTMSVGFVII